MAEQAGELALDPAQNGDLAPLARLYAAFFEEDGIGVPGGLAENIAAMLADPDALILIARSGEEMLGFASVTLTRGAEFGLSAEVEDLYVVTKARGQGVARRLLDAVLAEATVRGAAVAAIVITPEAEAEQGLTAFYARHGFRDSGRILMHRPLVPGPAQ